MAALTPEQQQRKNGIMIGAVVWGVVVAIIVGALAYWAGANLGGIWRGLLAAVLGIGLGVLTFRWRYNSGVAKAICSKCGTAFGIREVERSERFLSSDPKQKSESDRPASKVDRGTNKITTWVEEKYEVTAIDECFNCHDRTERKWTTTRDKDRVEREVPA
jgi:hypothetical protein